MFDLKYHWVIIQLKQKNKSAVEYKNKTRNTLNIFTVFFI